jgi:hypothetical protein
MPHGLAANAGQIEAMKWLVATCSPSFPKITRGCRTPRASLAGAQCRLKVLLSLFRDARRNAYPKTE